MMKDFPRFDSTNELIQVKSFPKVPIRVATAIVSESLRVETSALQGKFFPKIAKAEIPVVCCPCAFT